jgi:ATP-dependent Clp protease ATP-binding subunit ClpA
VEAERAKLLVLEERLHQRVVGQEEAVEAVSDAVRRSRAGLQDPNRPIGSFIFLGPTGVGKTELCKALAEVLFDDENAMVRIDMSEFMEKHTVARLIGAPPGYVGYEEGGLLTEAVRRRPYSVVLLDEMEKAHRDVFNVLLQVLDDGRLTDSLGHTVDFTNTIVVMTSNVGSQAIQEITKEGGGEQEIRDAVKEALAARFLPEFLNRIDETIIFHPLDKKHIRRIVDIQMQRLVAQAEKAGITLECSDKALDEVARLGYDPVYGARPLKRVIQQQLQNPQAFARGIVHRRVVQHQHKFTPQAFGLFGQPSAQILRGQGLDLLKLLGQLAPHGQSPAPQRRQGAGQRLHAVRRFQKNHGALFVQQFLHGLVARLGFAGQKAGKHKPAVATDAGHAERRGHAAGTR